MVLNDVFDADVDAREQPSRPIPSGRVSWRAAAAVGWGMWTTGVLIAWFISFLTNDWRPAAVATLLAMCVVLYDRILKRTPIAPLMMGACRALNVLLGMSLAPMNPMAADGLAASASSVTWASPAAWLIAAGGGIYIIGVTIFARTDARTSARAALTFGLIVLLSGMALLAVTPVLTENKPPLVVVRNGWFVLWALLAVITSRRCVAAIMQPAPQQVQSAVRHCVHSIIVVDAAVCVGYAHPTWGFAVLALIFPTVALTAWLRAT
jgi:4-hydroxybenzoate polyprenyltransferase